jgi:hypothetical protein
MRLEESKRKTMVEKPKKGLRLLACVPEKHTHFRRLYAIETLGIRCRRTDEFNFHV